VIKGCFSPSKFNPTISLCSSSVPRKCEKEIVACLVVLSSYQRLDDVNSLLGSWPYTADKWTSLPAGRHDHRLSILWNDDTYLIAPRLLYWQFGSIMLPFSSRAFEISKSANTVAAQMNHIEMPM